MAVSEATGLEGTGTWCWSRPCDWLHGRLLQESHAVTRAGARPVGSRGRPGIRRYFA